MSKSIHRSGLIMGFILVFICAFCFTMPTALAAPGFGGGSGAQEDPFQIKTVDNLVLLADLSDSYDFTDRYFMLSNDIDFSGQSIITRAGNNIVAFNGNFDGNNHTISNMTEVMNFENAGLFGALGGSGTIKNLNLKNFSIDTTSASTFQLGMLVGSNQGTISNCFVQGDLTGHNTQAMAYYCSKVGGLVGYNHSTASIENCSADVDVMSECDVYHAFAGGLVSDNIGSITGCGAFGSVTSTTHGANGNAYAGGFVAENMNIITNSYAAGNVSATADWFYVFSGGFAGKHKNETSTAATSIISQCYATGDVYGETKDTTDPFIPPVAGGFVGYNTYSINESFATGTVTTAVDAATEYNGGFSGFDDGYVDNCFASGTTVSETTEGTGAFTGYNMGDITNCCFNETAASGIGIGLVDDTATDSDVTAKSKSELFSNALITTTFNWASTDTEYNAAKIWRIAGGDASPVLQNQMFFGQPVITCEEAMESGAVDVAVQASWTADNISADSGAYIGYRTASGTGFTYVAANKSGDDYTATINGLDASTDYVFCAVGENYGQSINKTQTTAYSITVTKGDNGTVDPADADVQVVSGFDKEFTITANTDFRVSNLIIDGVAVAEAAGQSSYTYCFTNVSTDHTLDVNFEAIPTATPTPTPTPTPTTTPTPTQTPETQQKITVTGTVLDENGNPLEGVTVELHSDPMIVVTDEAGEFTFNNVEVTNHTLIIKNSLGTTLKEFAVEIETDDDFAWDEDSDTVHITVQDNTASTEFTINVDEATGEVTIEDIQNVVNPKTGDNSTSESGYGYVISLAVLLAGMAVFFVGKRRKAVRNK